PTRRRATGPADAAARGRPAGGRAALRRASARARGAVRGGSRTAGDACLRWL
ncbi:MAG: hypothetical protein AVDCRST_MAG79-2704, partial [uncultured Thermoleophilia bacterium]